MTQQIKTFQLDIDDELLLSGNPISNLGAVPKQYVDSAINGVNGSVGQVSIVTKTPTYTLLSNSMIHYNITFGSIPNNATITYTLPIANTSGEIVTHNSNVSGSILAGLIITNFNTTTITFQNNVGVAINAGLYAWSI